MGKITTAESYRQFINSPAIQTAKYFFNILLNEKYTSLESYISKIQTGKTPLKSNNKFYNSNDINWFKPSDIGNSIYLSDATSKVSKIAKDEKKITDFKKNTLLITCIGDIGRIGILKEDGTSNQQITGILLNEKVIPEYVYLYLVSNRELFTENGVLKTTLPIINQKIIINLKIKVPSIDLQKQVVDFFFEFIENKQISQILSVGNYTKEILKFLLKVNSSKTIGNILTTEIETQQTLLKKLRQSILQEAIEGKLTASWREENQNIESASVLLEKIKAEKEELIKEKKIKKQKPLAPIQKDEVPFEVPDGWVWCRLGKITNIVRGGSPRPAGDKRFYDGDIPFLKVADLTKDNGMYVNGYTYSIKKAGLRKTRYIKEEILMLTNSGATLGIPKICNFPTAFNDGIAAFIHMNNELYKPYFYFLLKSKTKWFLDEASRGQGQPNLNTNIIGNTLIALPSFKEQKQIVKKIESLFKICDELETQINTSKANAQRLMQSVLKEAFEE